MADYHAQISYADLDDNYPDGEPEWVRQRVVEARDVNAIYDARVTWFADHELLVFEAWDENRGPFDLPEAVVHLTSNPPKTSPNDTGGNDG